MTSADAGSVVIAVLSRAPQAGAVKTRLQPALTPVQAQQLHKALTRQVLADAVAVRVLNASVTTELWVSAAHPFFDELARDYSVTVHLQTGNDLGQKMAHIAASVLARARAVILVGADCPFIGASGFQRVIERLDEGNDVVLVPALDGGYALLGLRRIAAQLFADKRWGSGEVAAATIADFQQLGWRYHLAEAVSDIDYPADLARLKALPALAHFADWGV